MDKIFDLLATPLGQAVALGVGLALIAGLLKLVRLVLGVAKKEAVKTPTKVDDQLVDLAEDLVDDAEVAAKPFLQRLLGSAKKPGVGPKS